MRFDSLSSNSGASFCLLACSISFASSSLSSSSESSSSSLSDSLSSSESFSPSSLSSSLPLFSSSSPPLPLSLSSSLLFSSSLSLSLSSSFFCSSSSFNIFRCTALLTLKSIATNRFLISISFPRSTAFLAVNALANVTNANPR